MSGGTFDYKQHHIRDIIEEIEERMTEPYPENVKFILSEGVHALKRAYIFAKRIDWFLAGDDGEEDLYRRLFIELGELESNEMEMSEKGKDSIDANKHELVKFLNYLNEHLRLEVSERWVEDFIRYGKN